MEPNWDDLRAVHVLIERGTLAAAAEALGVNYTTISRRISRAEAALGERLFERLADGYAATDAGHLVADHVGRMQVEEDSLRRKLTGRDQTLRGPLVITAPQLLIGPALAPAFDAFTRAHPSVALEVRATNAQLDLERREADLAIRISNDPGDALTGRRLTRQDHASFATADWAARLEEDRRAPVDWVVFAAYGAVPKGADPAWPDQRVRMVFDDMQAMLGAAQAGLGVVRLPMLLGRTTPGLVPVPVLPPQPYFDLWMVAHRDVWPNAKVAAMRAELLAHVRATRHLYVA